MSAFSRLSFRADSEFRLRQILILAVFLLRVFARTRPKREHPLLFSFSWNSFITNNLLRDVELPFLFSNKIRENIYASCMKSRVIFNNQPRVMALSPRSNFASTLISSGDTSIPIISFPVLSSHFPPFFPFPYRSNNFDPSLPLTAFGDLSSVRLTYRRTVPLYFIPRAVRNPQEGSAEDGRKDLRDSRRLSRAKEPARRTRSPSTLPRGSEKHIRRAAGQGHVGLGLQIDDRGGRRNMNVVCSGPISRGQSAFRRICPRYSGILSNKKE